MAKAIKCGKINARAKKKKNKTIIAIIPKISPDLYTNNITDELIKLKIYSSSNESESTRCSSSFEAIPELHCPNG